MKEVIESENNEKAKENANSVLQCTLYNIYFFIDKAKRTHFKKKHAAKYKCPYNGCDSKFANKVNYELHEKFHDKISQIQLNFTSARPATKFSCTIVN